MPSSAQQKNTAPTKSAAVSDIHDFFERYGATFVDLAVGKRSDMQALLNYYSAPLRFIGPTFHLIMRDNAELLGPQGMGGEIEQLHREHFAGSHLDQCNINVLNDRAALVDALWLRRDSTGAIMARFKVIYLIALTKDGWRITSAVNTAT
jgi:hypothetical protein